MCPGSTIKSLCVYRVKTRLLVRSFRPFQKNGETAQPGWLVSLLSVSRPRY